MGLHDDIVRSMLQFRGKTLKTSEIVAACANIDYPSGTGPVQPPDHSADPPLRPHCDFGGANINGNDNCGRNGKLIFKRTCKRGYHEICQILYWSDGSEAS